MKRQEALTRLQAHQHTFKAMGVRHMFLFGSVARNAAKVTSDVDIFIDYRRDGTFGLFALMEVKEKCRRILRRKTDLGTRDGLHPRLKRQIVQSAVRVF